NVESRHASGLASERNVMTRQRRSKSIVLVEVQNLSVRNWAEQRRSRPIPVGEISAEPRIDDNVEAKHPVSRGTGFVRIVGPKHLLSLEGTVEVERPIPARIAIDDAPRSRGRSYPCSAIQNNDVALDGLRTVTGAGQVVRSDAEGSISQCVNFVVRNNI